MGVQPDMSGFLSWYARRCGEWRYPHKLEADEHHKVMHAYTPRDLPVLRYPPHTHAHAARALTMDSNVQHAGPGVRVQ
jgi:hypothetical protein